jgi:hypothetical protein
MAIRVGKITNISGYTLVVDGNDGEEQLIIITSPGQDKRTAIQALRAQVDGTVESLLSVTQPRLQYNPLLTLVKKIANEWVTAGLPGGLSSDVDKIVAAFVKQQAGG